MTAEEMFKKLHYTIDEEAKSCNTLEYTQEPYDYLVYNTVAFYKDKTIYAVHHNDYDGYTRAAIITFDLLKAINKQVEELKEKGVW